MPSKPKAAVSTYKKTTTKSAKSNRKLNGLRAKLFTTKGLTAVVFVVVFAGIGSYLLLKSKALTPPAPPQAGGYFSTLAPGSALPSESTCASRIVSTGWEPRPENAKANNTVPTSVSIPGYGTADGYDQRARAYADRVTGNFKGTTDQIVQWASCKWGFNDDIVRAVMVGESNWYQGVLDANGQPVNGKGYGDFTTDPAGCAPGYTVPCPQSFGITQVKWTSYPGTFSNSRDSTAFNLDYNLMVRRVCYEGWMNWLKPYHPDYQAGNEWGCVGHWYTGSWGGDSTYIATAQANYNNKPWLQWPHIYPQPPLGSVSLSFTPTSVAPGGGQITVNYTVPAGNANVKDWIALYKQGDPSTTYGEWHYTQGNASGTMTFNAPATAGTYEFRYNYNDSYTTVATSGPLTVGSGGTPTPPPPSSTYTLSPSPTSVNPGATITVSWTAPSGQTFAKDWIAMYKQGAASSAYGEWHYTNGAASGSMTFTAPATAGTYEFRYLQNDGYTSVATSPAVTVGSAPPPPPTTDTTPPTVSIASPANGITIGSSVTINATATDNVKVTKMEVWIDGSLKASSTSGSISYSWSSRRVASGTHTITVKAYDAAGNVGQGSETVYK